MFALRNEGTKTLLKKKSPNPEELFGIVIKPKNIIILKKKNHQYKFSLQNKANICVQ
jgi:hypothetical protein